MRPVKTSLPVLSVAFMLSLAPAYSGVILTLSGIAPVPGVGDQFNLGTDAVVPGGTTPLGGAYNSQAFSDNAGPPGQTFTMDSSSNFTLDSFSFKGAEATAGNFGGFGGGGVTWGLRLSSVSGTTLTPIFSVADIATPAGLTGSEWLTWTFSDAEKVTLLASTTYAIEVYSSTGYLGFDAAVSPASYTGGVAFNNGGGQRTFSSTLIQDRGYDRTFVADVTAVPEPASGLLLLGAAGLLARRRR